MLDFGFYNIDCMEGMKEFPDKYFNLAIIDPPYGIMNGRKFGYKKNTYTKINEAEKWDKRPDKKYFKELERICKNRIIWGMQYFTSDLSDFKSVIVWDKKNGNNNSGDGEIAYCSLDGTVRFIRHAYIGRYNPDPIRIHATQKPVYLYRWLLKNYAKQGDKILDTHVGSSSSLI